MPLNGKEDGTDYLCKKSVPLGLFSAPYNLHLANKKPMLAIKCSFGQKFEYGLLSLGDIYDASQVAVTRFNLEI